jgi:dolichol-phosphate mannosyltransferase
VSRPPSAGAPALSLVVPVRDEAGNVGHLADAVAVTAAALGAFELVFVDDGSSDGTAEAVLQAAARHPFVRLVAHVAPAGQSAAVHSGVLLARAPLICTLDGDGQNPPAEIPKLLARLEAGEMPPGIGLIAGQRVGRHDSRWKRLGSAVANGLRARLLRDGTRDTGCGLKLFRRDAFLALPYFDHMHRFLPALFARDGWGTVHVDVAHAPRRAGRSKYGNLSRAVVGIHDLFGVSWLIRRRKKAEPAEREVRR